MGSGDEAEKFKMFFLHGPGLSAIADVQGRIEHASVAWEEVLGWSRGEVESKLLVDLTHPPDQETCHAALAATLASGEKTTWVARVVAKNGALVWLRWEGRRGPDGRSLFLSAIEAARWVREADRSTGSGLLLDALARSAPFGIIQFDVSGVVVGWNPAAERIFGYTAGEIVGSSGAVLAASEAGPGI